MAECTAQWILILFLVGSGPSIRPDSPSPFGFRHFYEPVTLPYLKLAIVDLFHLRITFVKTSLAFQLFLP